MILISIGWFCPYRNRYCPYPDLSHLMASSMFALDNFKVKTKFNGKNNYFATFTNLFFVHKRD